MFFHLIVSPGLTVNLLGSNTSIPLSLPNFTVYSSAEALGVKTAKLQIRNAIVNNAMLQRRKLDAIDFIDFFSQEAFFVLYSF